jgi:hypothetical protein
MFPELKRHIDSYKHIAEVLFRLETVQTELEENQELLEAVLPWIDEKRKEIEKSEGFFNFNVFENKDVLQAEVREQHHKLVLRARDLQHKIDLLEYEEKVLKGKRVQLPSVIYAFEKFADETKMEILDKESRELLNEIKNCKDIIRQNIAEQKAMVKSIEHGRAIDALFVKLTMFFQNAVMDGEFHPLFGKLRVKILGEQSNVWRAKETAKTIAIKIKIWDQEVSELLFKEDSGATFALSKRVTEKNLTKMFAHFFINYSYISIINTYNKELSAIRTRTQKLSVALEWLKDQKEALAEEKHHLMMGESL